MHNNFFFLRQLSSSLEHHLVSSTLVSCFSQVKDELVIEFNNGQVSFFIRAILQADFSCLTFPRKFHRARKNSVDLFNALLMKKVERIHQYNNERSFGIHFEGELQLIFKMHGTRANVLLTERGEVSSMFRSHIETDLQLDPAALDRDIDWSKEAFLAHRHELKKLYFTFGSPLWRYLDQQGFTNAGENDQWSLITSLREQLEQPAYYVVEDNGKILLALVPLGKIIAQFDDPVAAVTEFAQMYSAGNAFVKEKHDLVVYWKSRVQSTENYLLKTRARLAELDAQQYKNHGDLLMANMHAVPQGVTTISLPDFSGAGTVEIKLDPRLSPQKNAERFYRKAKNQHQEVTRLNDALQTKSVTLAEAQAALAQAQSLTDLHAVRSAAASITPLREEAVIALPYRELMFEGYRIWIGKDARSNDELTLKFASKDDLWLHARDVAGSHVVVKHQGKTVPKPVIERAAELAAYYSKRKTESLCPVIVTQKKFVRKRKGDPPGAVVVEREEVVMVEPRG